MVIKVEINGLIDAARIIAGAINGLANRIAPKSTMEKTGEAPEHNRKKGPRTGYVRPDNLAKKIARVTGGDPKEICRYLWANFGSKLVAFDGNRKGFTKATERSIFHLMTNGK